MKRSYINKIGKQGKKNTDEYKKIKEHLAANPTEYCEAGLEGCLHIFNLQIAHRRRRNDYYSGEHSLSDPNEYIVACDSCHKLLDRRTPEAWALTEKLFKTLRP